jgi:hypothetical protein
MGGSHDFNPNQSHFRGTVSSAGRPWIANWSALYGEYVSLAGDVAYLPY